MRASKLLFAVMLVASVPQASAGADADAARKAEFMRAVFAERYNAGKGAAVAMVPVDGEQIYHTMSPLAINHLPDGRTVLIVNGSPSDAQGEQMAAHASPGMLNVYLLRRDGTRWTVIERHENVALLGSSGHIGVIRWTRLGPGKPGFIVSNGGVWQGYWIRHAAIFALEAGVRGMGSFAEGSGSDGACVPEMAECWHVEGKIRFAPEPQASGYQDIVVDFSDRRYTVTDNGKADPVEHIKSQSKQTARYHFDGKAYELVSGTNPVPGI